MSGCSISRLLAVIDDLDRQLAPLERELRPLARSDERAKLLMTIPGIVELLGLTIASEIGDISRFSSARKLVGYAGLVPKVKQSGQSSRIGRLTKAGPDTLLGRRRSRAASVATKQPVARAFGLGANRCVIECEPRRLRCPACGGAYGAGAVGQAAQRAYQRP